MPQAEKKVTCPGCAHEFSVAARRGLGTPGLSALRGQDSPSRRCGDFPRSAEDLALGFKPGQQIGNYVIEALLGSGGMAVVFRGRQLSLNRNVAIKILPKDLAKNKLFIQRFDERSDGPRQPESPEYRQRD